MSISIKEKLIARAQQLLEKGQRVKNTHKTVTHYSVSTLDADVFFEWKTGVENFIIQTQVRIAPIIGISIKRQTKANLSLM